MEKFTTCTSLAAPLIRDNIDTDAIIPSREMKRVSKKGLSVGLFAGWRYLDQKRRTPDPDFILNQAIYSQSKILLSGKNFGCGSSREHAVWALAEYGIKAIIAPSFSNIFYGNCIRNGLLPIRLDAEKISILSKKSKALFIDLETQKVDAYPFEIEAQNKEILLNGLDQITMTQHHQLAIDDFISKDRLVRKWAHL
ncbi:3-isopropylmalate dehydratase small subunit [Temperatibacter marinus]|uniref:3-isopropylmalate dehydratase small subunit n=1 Tax=Temperatibacter marinus TaxID=1456591 RepID=A0AA52HA19_9PROT|nr:3-isopropylmalate dehydratase small subunit [Temperatibacter marinus]WND03519.1 3-isopropylmalate dehydratase small subunit [Temperatibacter marinus]